MTTYQVATAGIIDDDHIYQLVMKRTLEQTGMVRSILQFYDGEQAIDFFKDKTHSVDVLPQLILLDINMPYMNGWQFLDEFAKIDFKLDYKLTIYVVTSSSTKEDMNRAKQYSIVTGYHVKPVTKDECIAMMKTVTGIA